MKILIFIYFRQSRNTLPHPNLYLSYFQELSETTKTGLCFIL